MIKRFNPDFSLSISHELAYMRETPEGGYVAQGDYATLFSELEVVKAERDALERQLSMSEAKCKGYFSDAAAALVRCDALAVENGQLKEMNGSLCAELQEYESDNDDFGQAPQSVVNCFALLTPNTDAALAAIRTNYMAEGAEIVASKAQVIYQERHKSGDFESAGKYLTTIKFANNIASDIREAK